MIKQMKQCPRCQSQLDMMNRCPENNKFINKCGLYYNAGIYRLSLNMDGKSYQIDWTEKRCSLLTIKSTAPNLGIKQLRNNFSAMLEYRDLPLLPFTITAQQLKTYLLFL